MTPVALKGLRCVFITVKINMYIHCTVSDRVPDILCAGWTASLKPSKPCRLIVETGSRFQGITIRGKNTSGEGYRLLVHCKIVE